MEPTKKNFYTIKVEGGNPTPAYEGKLSKEDNRPEGKTTEVFLQLGVKSIPNFSRVWGEQIIDKTTKKPNGKINFMDWGTPGGRVVEIRYHPSSSSIDKFYQEQIEKLVLKQDGDENAEIRLKVGLNKFDVATKPLLVEMLKHHTFCGDNKSRNPESQDILYFEHNGQASLIKMRSESKLKHEAEGLVLDAREKRQLAVLASIFGIDRREEDEFIEEALTLRIQEPGDGARILPGYKKFLNIIAAKKQEMLTLLLEASEQDVLVGSDGGEVMIREEGKHVPLLPGVTQDGESVVEFLLDNILTVEYFDAVVRVGGALERYKELQFN